MTTFGTITNIQFVANRSTLKENSPVNKVSFFGSHSPGPFITANSEGLNGDCVSHKNIDNGKGCYKSPGTPNGFYGNGFHYPCTITSPHANFDSASRPSSTVSGNSSSKGSDILSPGLAVEEGPAGTLRFATDRPHLVSMGGGRLSTSVTLHPINEGSTILGSGGMGVVPDIAVLGTGVEPEHCLLEHKDNTVHLTPLAPLVSIDGIKIFSRTRLTQGCMICLGRSHFFRFNHPTEAKLMRSILPNARISMAPIAFYPAVDNPEYFHMSAQEAGAGEEVRVSSSDSSTVGGGGSTRPPVPPRKSPPSTLSLPLDDALSLKINNNKAFHTENTTLPSPSGNINEGNVAHKKLEEVESSDSDSPPEVPPRSEGTCPQYVNSVTSADAMKYNYLGEYIYTQGKEDLEILGMAGTSAMKHVVAGGAATIVCQNGMTTVHNAMYRSIPASLSPQEISPSLVTTNITPTSALSAHFFPATDSNAVTTTSPSSIASSSPTTTTILPRHHHHYSTPKSPIPVGDTIPSKSPVYIGESFKSLSPYIGESLLHRMNNKGNIIERQTFQSGIRSPSKTSSEDLRNSELKKNRAHEERLREEETAEAEKARLEEILKMCAEYERQQSEGSPTSVSASNGESTTPTKSQNSPYHTLTQNRIKTNGSLPREKRSPLSSPPPSQMGIISPTGSIPPLSPPLPSSLRAGTPSEDELNSIFSFESDHGRGNIPNHGSHSRSESLCHYPPFPNLSSGLVGTPSPPPISPRSPYENVSVHHHGLSVPQSPRTRIRTTVGKDRRDFCEVFENKIALNDIGSLPLSSESKKLHSDGNTRDSFKKYSPKENGFVDVPPKPPRSPRIEREILDLSPQRDREIMNVIDNKYFADVTPKIKMEKGRYSKQSEEYQNGENCVNSAVRRNCLRFPPPPSSPPVASIDMTRNRTKVFEKQMIKNIQDTLNINDVASEVERLNDEKNKALRETADLKGKITELESQENEALRELEMERALLEGELNCLRCELKRDEAVFSALLEKSAEMDKKHNEERARDKKTIYNCKIRLESAESELDNLDRKDGGFSEEENKEKDEILKLRHDAVEAEKKIFEDIEFSQMESEALRESEREELNKEVSDMKEQLESQKEKLLELESQMADMTSSVRTETDSLECERQDLLSRMSKVMLHVSSVDRQMAELARLGVVPVPNGRLSPSSSSDTEESSGADLADRLAQLHLLDRSQEDLDRIHQVTTASPLEYRDGTLGRKTSAALMEVERNRQLTLVKQGTQVINDERKRVEELKRRVAQEVKVEWEERRKERAEREVACTSLDSVGSEESSLTSSDMHAESLSSDDVIAQRSSGESSIKVVLKMRQKDSETLPCFEEQSRPLSDAASSCDTEGQPPVRFREKVRTQQRPLTRYLPVRSEEHFDLRQHIESAGHQIELCPYLTVNHMSCRGYLHKLGSKFRTWQKRWFVFDRTKHALIYFSDKSESKPKGGTYFQAIEDVYVDHHSVKSPSPKLTFCVKTHERTFQLMAPSPEAMRIWIDVIFTGAEGYQEFQGGT